jgi:DNA-binding Lrp family transcriptional regulator
MRKTFGWHKTKDKISITQLEKMTGLSRPTIIKSLESLEERGVIVVERVGQIKSYSVNIDNETSKESLPGEDANQLKNFTSASKESLPDETKTSKESLHTKESNINKIKENIDFSKIEKSYAEEYEKLKGHKPTLIFAALRSRIKKLVAQGIDESLILNVIRAATKDEWIVANGYEILTILSDKMIMRLANETQSSRTSSPKKGVTCPRCGSEVIAGICTKCRALIDSEGKELT